MVLGTALQQAIIRHRKDPRLFSAALEKRHGAPVHLADIGVHVRIFVFEKDPIDPPGVEQRQHAQPADQPERSQLSPTLQIEQHRARPGDQRPVQSAPAQPVEVPAAVPGGQGFQFLRGNLSAQNRIPEIGHSPRRHRHHQPDPRQHSPDDQQPAVQRLPFFSIHFHNAAQAHAGQRAGRKGEDESRHARSAHDLDPGQQVKGQPVHRRVSAQGVSQGQDEQPAHEQNQRLSPRFEHRCQRQQQNQDTEVFGVVLHPIAAPVVAPSLLRLVESPELGHHQRSHFLGMQGPAARPRQLRGRAFAPFRTTRPFRLGARVRVERKSALCAQGQPERHGESEEPGAWQNHPQISLSLVSPNDLEQKVEPQPEQRLVEHLRVR